MSDPLRATLDAHKREAFDAMRAYHLSEIEHKAHGIAMLTTVLTGVGAVFAAIVVPATPVPNAVVIAFLAAAAASIGAHLVVSSTNGKLESDHARYAAFGEEYMRTARLLGLYAEQTLDGRVATVKTDEGVGQGRGYVGTQRILEKFGWFVALLGWVAFAYVALSSR